jgi:predicted transcriptional regulator
MEKQNITLSVPKDVLHKVKLIAVQRQTSVSAMLTQTLEQIVEREETYALASRRHLEWLNRGADLGTAGQAPAGRGELHERA